MTFTTRQVTYQHWVNYYRKRAKHSAIFACFYKCNLVKALMYSSVTQQK